jgi:uncharacterized membrane protein
MAETSDKEPGPGPVIEEVLEADVQSSVAVAGHPLHAMGIHFPIALAIATLGVDIFYWFTGDPFWVRVSLWSSGFAFASAAAAGLIGTAEIILVRGIRIRVASWTHAIAAMMLISILGLNWGLRMVDTAQILPHGLLLSILGSLFTGLAGWHGGKLVFDHGIGLIVSDTE